MKMMNEENALLISRLDMVRHQIKRRGITDQRLLSAMRKVLRHEFVPEAERANAYRDGPVPIGHNQTISQPYIVAYMTNALELTGGESILEIGTGSGYQTAILAELVAHVETIEVVEALALVARMRLEGAGYTNISFRIGDGRKGWLEKAPFDGIIVTAAPETDPIHLTDQLVNGGRLVVPVGGGYQILKRFTRRGSKLDRENLLDVRFVPLV